MTCYNFYKYRYEESAFMEEIVDICKALSDQSRLIIVSKLKKIDELCACNLLEMVKCNQSTLSHHMKILVDCGLVIARKD